MTRTIADWLHLVRTGVVSAELPFAAAVLSELDALGLEDEHVQRHTNVTYDVITIDPPGGSGLARHLVALIHAPGSRWWTTLIDRGHEYGTGFAVFVKPRWFERELVGEVEER